MKRLIFILLATIALFPNSLALSADVSSHVMTFDFQTINEIGITGTPSLTISFAVAGDQPQEATDNSTTYAITTNGINKKITASIDMAMPSSVMLELNAAAPSGSGISQGDVTLGVSAANVVTGISHVAENNLSLNYKLSGTVQAGVISVDTRTVTFTLLD